MESGEDFDEDLAQLKQRAFTGLSSEGEDSPCEESKLVSEEQKSIMPAGELKASEMEQVMTNGMQFLAGLYKMSTGKELGLENQRININKETGEVTFTFKLPV